MSSHQSEVVLRLGNSLFVLQVFHIRQDNSVAVLLFADLVLMFSVEVVHLCFLLIDQVLTLIGLALSEGLKESSFLGRATSHPFFLVFVPLDISISEFVTCSVESFLFFGLELDFLVFEVESGGSEKNGGLIGQLSFLPGVFKLLIFNKLCHLLCVCLFHLSAFLLPHLIAVFEGMSHFTFKLGEIFVVFPLVLVLAQLKLPALEDLQVLVQLVSLVVESVLLVLDSLVLDFTDSFAPLIDLIVDFEFQGFFSLRGLFLLW